MSLLLSFIIDYWIYTDQRSFSYRSARIVLILNFYYQGIKYRLKVQTNVKTTVVLIEIVREYYTDKLDYNF